MVIKQNFHKLCQIANIETNPLTKSNPVRRQTERDRKITAIAVK